jgi:S1-C subfamily serine protease
VTTVDWIIVAFTLALAYAGWQQGFLAGGLSLAGFAAGAFLGTRLGPLLLPDGARSPYAPMFGLVGALMGGGLLATGLEGVGHAVRSRTSRLPGIGSIDGLLGGALAAAVALGIAWIAGAVALQLPGQRDLRRTVQRSVVLRALNDALPPSGAILHALARFDPLPSFNGPRADVPPPNARIARDPQVQAARASVVRVLGTACGLGIEGSGWVAPGGVVVTNAHVVAGESDTTVQVRGTGPKLSAQPVAFDARNDIALLRVNGLSAPSLPLRSDPPSGVAGAILGFPENGPYSVRAARIGATTRALAQDAYGNGPLLRELVSLRGVVRHGNSGGPLVDGAGRVLTTVFAATAGTRRHGGFGVPNAVVRAAMAGAHGPVGTGPCAP